MNKLRKALALVLAVCCIIGAAPVSAYAEQIPGEGLAVFDDVADMTNTTFSDLSTNFWGYSGIEVSYNKGIMIGYPNGTFGFDDYVTWAHALTIAARIHATYYGNALNETPRTGEKWFDPFYRYCSLHGMLPSSCPTGSGLDGIINRYDLAYLFSRTIGKEDMPAISDLAINDASSIPAYYMSSVKTLYSAGILIGMDGYNNFLGTYNTTRAQIATVVARLLLPAERKGSDSKANADMAPYEANLENDSVTVQIGSTYYCLYKSYETVDTVRYGLYASDGVNEARALYTAQVGQYLNNISVYNGKVYFCLSTSGAASGSLMCYDPAAGRISTVYTGYIIESYCFYNGGLYALAFTTYADQPSGYVYSFGKIVNGGFNAFLTDLSYSQVPNFVPYGWNGLIYFKMSEPMTVKDADGNESQVNVDKLYSYDEARGSVQKVADYKINTSFFDGPVMYFLAYDSDGNYDLNLYAISIQTPGAVKVVGEFPKTTNVRNRSLYKFGDTIYCLSSFNRNVYSMDQRGSTRLAIMCGGVYNSMNFTADKLVLIPNTLVTSNANELKVYNASSLANRALYGDWLGQSVYYSGARFTPEKGKDFYSTTDSVSSVSNLPITVTKAFSRGDDFIVQTKYVNLTDTTIKLRSYIVKVYVDDKLVAYDLNRMVGFELKANDIQSFTFVIAGADILQNFDVNDGRIGIEIVPTYDIVPETTKN